MDYSVIKEPRATPEKKRMNGGYKFFFVFSCVFRICFFFRGLLMDYWWDIMDHNAIMNYQTWQRVNSWTMIYGSTDCLDTNCLDTNCLDTIILSFYFNGKTSPVTSQNKGGLRTQKQNDSKQIWVILIIGLFLFRLLPASFWKMNIMDAFTANFIFPHLPGEGC